MKKTIIILLAALMIFATACSSKTTSSISIGNLDLPQEIQKKLDETLSDMGLGSGTMGGWTVQEGEISEDAQAAFDKAMEEWTGVSYEPVSLIATQVVAGTNYLFLCKSTLVTAQPVDGYALVKIYADLNDGAEVLDITDLGKVE